MHSHIQILGPLLRTEYKMRKRSRMRLVVKPFSLPQCAMKQHISGPTHGSQAQTPVTFRKSAFCSVALCGPLDCSPPDSSVHGILQARTLERIAMPWRRAWQSAPVFLPGESHGQRSLAGYSPGGRRERLSRRQTF